VILLKFYCAEGDMTVKAIRKDRAFVNKAIPKAVAFLSGRKPDHKLWNGARLKELRLLTYPTIKENEWHTYRKNNDGKSRKVTLAQCLAKNRRSQDE